MLLLVAPFVDLLDQLMAEDIQVIGLAAGHQAVIHHHLLVDPVGACIAQILFDTRVGGQPATFTTPALIRIQGAWQIAATGLCAWKKALTKLKAFSSWRRASGLNRPPGNTKA